MGAIGLLGFGVVVVGSLALARVRKLKRLIQFAQTRIYKQQTFSVKPDLEIPQLSILVPAWEEAKKIEALIGAVKGIKYPKKQLVIAAGGQDGTFETAQKYAEEDVLVIRQNYGEGKQASLRKCLLHSTGEIIALIDGDCIPENRKFQQLLEPILLGKESVTTGDYEPLPNQQISHNPFVHYQWAIRKIAWLLKGSYIDGIVGGNVVLTRNSVELAGNFVEPVFIGTDRHLAIKLNQAGFVIRKVDNAAMPTEFPERFSSYFRQQSRWGRNIVLHSVKNRHVREILSIIPQIVISLTIILGPLTVPILGIYAAVIWFLVLLHSVVTRIVYLQAAKSIPDEGAFHRLTFLHLFIFTIVDAGSWLMTVIDLFTVARRQRW